MKMAELRNHPGLAALLSVACFGPQAVAQEQASARLAILGRADVALYGQEGYCGSMESYDKSNTAGVPIAAGQRTWFRLKHQRSCAGDFSFVPEPGQAYVLVAGTPAAPCSAGLFRLRRGQLPQGESMDREEARSCLFPWNHLPRQAPAASAAAGDTPAGDGLADERR